MDGNILKAKELINQCKQDQNFHLDLGNCGLVNLNEIPELFECTHLESLNLSSTWWDFHEEYNLHSYNVGDENDIKILSKNFVLLKNLKKLILSGGFELKWEIIDIEVLKNLPGLRYLDLSSNHVKDYSFLENLSELEHLFLATNSIEHIIF